MIRPNIIKIQSHSDWLLTFTVLDPDTELPATIQNTFVKFNLYDAPRSRDPLWSGEWNTGVQEDRITPGVIHVLVPRKISDYLPEGMYSYELNVTSKTNTGNTRKDIGLIESVNINPNDGITFGVADGTARRMVKDETLRALRAEEELREDIGSGTGGEIPDGSVTTAKLAYHAVTADKLDPNAIPDPTVPDESITTRKLADQAVTRAKIAEGVIPDPLPQNSVSTDMLRTGCVTTDKIENGAITADKIAAGAIPPAVIEDSSITSDKIANEAITSDKIHESSILPSHLSEGLVVNEDDLAEILASKLRPGTITMVDTDADPELSIRQSGDFWYFDMEIPSSPAPEIGEDGFWYIGGEKTEYRAQGENSVGIINISQIGTTDPVTRLNTYRITLGYRDGTIVNTYDYSLHDVPLVPSVQKDIASAVSSGGVYKALNEDAIMHKSESHVRLTGNEYTSSFDYIDILSAHTTATGNNVPILISEGGDSSLENMFYDHDISSVTIDFSFVVNNELSAHSVGVIDVMITNGASGRGFITVDGTRYFIEAASCTFNDVDSVWDLLVTYDSTHTVLVKFRFLPTTVEQQINDPYVRQSTLDNLISLIRSRLNI